MFTVYFSIVRYVPDPFRQEFVNVGAVVALPQAGHVEIRVRDRMKKRLTCLDPNYDEDLLKSFPAVFESVARRLAHTLRDTAVAAIGAGWEANVEDSLWEVVRTFATSKIQLAPFQPAEIYVDTPEPVYASQLLDDLMVRYVAPPARASEAEIRKSDERAPKRLFEEALRKRDLLGGSGRGLVQPNFQLPVARKVRFDYGFQNGAVHVFETIDLSEAEKKKSDTLFSTTGGALVKILEARKVLEDQRLQFRPYTLMAGPVDDVDYLDVGMQMLRDNSRLVNVEDADQLNGLVLAIERALHRN